jgi:Hemerythrin HHE cation binding domain
VTGCSNGRSKLPDGSGADGIEEMPVTAQGEALYQDLLWVHGLLRQDLATVERLAVEVAEGAPAEDVVAGVRALETAGPLWRLRASCLHYCRFVHHHHRLEDVALFPELRRVNPSLGPVVDRLQEDHRRVAGLLQRVESAAGALEGTDSPEARAAVAESLEALAAHLLAHLDLEEESVAETLRRWEPAGPASP